MKQAMQADGSGSPYANTLIPLQRAVTWAHVAPSTSQAVGATPSRPRCRLVVALALGFGTFAYANGSIAKVLSSDKDRASSPPDGLLKDNPPPSAPKQKHYRERSELAPGVARMGLMDFEAARKSGTGGVLRCTSRTPDDEATKKGANPNSGRSDEKR